MDFDKILESWESGAKNKQSKGNPMDDWLEKYPPSPEVHRDNEEDQPEHERSRLRRMPPQRVIDLHGLSGREAVGKAEQFLWDAYRAGLRKVLIIHGKGLHSADTPVLRDEIRRLLDRLPFTGDSGHPSRKNGGTGAVWVILRERKR